MTRIALVFTLAAGLAGCATLPAACPPGLARQETAELLFGRNIAGAPGVTDADWTAFVDAEITPRFPDGLTVLDGQGQWRGESGVVEREGSKLVLLVLSGSPDEAARLDAVRAAYKARFRQEAVLLIRRPACIAF